MADYLNREFRQIQNTMNAKVEMLTHKQARRSTRRSQVFNATLLTIPKNTVVYQDDWNGLYDAATIRAAEVDNPSHLPVFGILDADIPPSNLGWATEEGLFEYGDTYHWDIRDLLFLDVTPGDIGTDTVSRQLFGYVVYKHRIAGKIYVTGSKKLHDTGELDGRHPVRGTDPINASDLTTGTAVAGEILVADGTGGSDWQEVWVHGVTMTGSLTGTTFTMAYSDLIEESILLVVRGLTKNPGVNFSIVGDQLIMSEAPFRAGDPPAVVSFDNFFIHSARRAA